MIRFSAALVAVAAVLLVAGIITSDLKLVYVAIGVSSVALLALAIGWFLNKDKLSASSFVAESVTGSASAVPEASVPVAAGVAGSQTAESVPSGLVAAQGLGSVPIGLGSAAQGLGSAATGLGSAPQAGAPWGPASGRPEAEPFTGSSTWPPAPADGTNWAGNGWGDVPVPGAGSVPEAERHDTGLTDAGWTDAGLTGYAPAAQPVGYVPPAEPFAPFVPEPAAVEQSPDPDAATRTDPPTEKTPVLPVADEAETSVGAETLAGAEASVGTETSVGAEASVGTEFSEVERVEVERVEVEPLSADLVESAGAEEPSSSPEERPDRAGAEVDGLVEPSAGDTPADGTAQVAAPADDTPADEVAGADTAAEADSADGSGSGEAPADATSEAPDPTREVTVVPGVPRYHDAGCILIRFMGEDDLEKKTLGAAAETGCTPCRACLPD